MEKYGVLGRKLEEKRKAKPHQSQPAQPTGQK
jgi:hypothetical protein